MALDDAAILGLLADPDKRIVGDLRWTELDDQPGSREVSASGHAAVVRWRTPATDPAKRLSAERSRSPIKAATRRSACR